MIERPAAADIGALGPVRDQRRGDAAFVDIVLVLAEGRIGGVGPRRAVALERVGAAWHHIRPRAPATCVLAFVSMASVSCRPPRRSRRCRPGTESAYCRFGRPYRAPQRCVRSPGPCGRSAPHRPPYGGPPTLCVGHLAMPGHADRAPSVSKTDRLNRCRPCASAARYGWHPSPHRTHPRTFAMSSGKACSGQCGAV